MERRLTAFLIPVLLLCGLYLTLFGGPPRPAGGEAPAPVQEAPADEAPAGAATAGEATMPATGDRRPPPRSVPAAPAGETRVLGRGGTGTPPEALRGGRLQDPDAGNGATQGAERGAQVADDYVDVLFGARGQRGSFHVTFDVRAADVVRVRLLDHAAEAGTAIGSDTPLEAFYEIVTPIWEGSAGGYVMPSLLLEELRPSDEFTTRRFDGLGDSRWQHELLPDGRGVVFTFDCGDGLTLEKRYVHERGRQDLRLEIAARLSGEHPRAGRQWGLRLLGPTLPNPPSSHLLGNPAMAVGGTVDIATQARDSRAVSPGSEADGTTLVARGGSVQVRFAGTTNRFFAGLLYPDDAESQAALSTVDQDAVPDVPSPRNGDVPANSVPRAKYLLNLRLPDGPGESRLTYRVYLGPKSARAFERHPDYERFEPVMDYALSPMCFCDVPFAVTLAKFLLWLMNLLHDAIGSWGLAIVLLTIIVRGSLVPLNFRMQKSMRAFAEKSGRLKPKMDEIQRKYAKDKQQLQRELLKFQREHKLFPPLGGCLPMFVTIPIFLGLFTALRVAYELRHEPFFPYIVDLSQPDRLLETGLSWFPHFNLLPILMVGLWFYLQMQTPLPKDPQQRQMMKIMRWMPVLFGVMLYNYASGLMVYMITSSLFAICEQRVVRKILGPMPETSQAMPMAPAI